MIEATYLNDQFLIAMPALGDPNFARTVTYLCQHTASGALGIIINRPTHMTLGDILEQMEIVVADEEVAKAPVYAGGPVQPERGFVIHSPVGAWDSSLTINPNIALTTSRDILEAVAVGQGPRRFFIALGYAGWGEGQLEQEMVQNAWLSTPMEASILFDIPANRRWKTAAQQMGVDLDLISMQAGHS